MAVLVAAAWVTERELDPDDESPPPRLEVIACEDAALGEAAAKPPMSTRLGPLTLVGIRRSIGMQADAFANNGFKIPVVVGEGQVVTLAAADSARPNVRFAYTRRSAKRASQEGVGGAPPTVRFESCERRRTGYPGGIIIRRRGCYPIVVRQAGEEPIRRRIPLGRAC